MIFMVFCALVMTAQIKEIEILCSCTLSDQGRDLTLAKTKLEKTLSKSEDI